MKFEDLKLKLVSLVRNRIGQLFEARSPMRVLAEAGLLLKVGQLEVQVNKHRSELEEYGGVGRFWKCGRAEAA